MLACARMARPSTLQGEMIWQVARREAFKWQLERRGCLPPPHAQVATCIRAQGRCSTAMPYRGGGVTRLEDGLEDVAEDVLVTHGGET